jgi:hypothetical protein
MGLMIMLHAGKYSPLPEHPISRTLGEWLVILRADISIQARA